MLPGCKFKGGVNGVDFIDDGFDLKLFAVQHLGWNGDEKFRKEYKESSQLSLRRGVSGKQSNTKVLEIAPSAKQIISNKQRQPSTKRKADVDTTVCDIFIGMLHCGENFFTMFLIKCLLFVFPRARHSGHAGYGTSGKEGRYSGGKRFNEQNCGRGVEVLQRRAQ